MVKLALDGTPPPSNGDSTLRSGLGVPIGGSSRAAFERSDQALNCSPAPFLAYASTVPIYLTGQSVLQTHFWGPKTHCKQVAFGKEGGIAKVSLSPFSWWTVDVGTDDFKAKAMEEMMARIKTGVVLRSARKDGDPWSMVSRRRVGLESLGSMGSPRSRWAPQ